ncbi:transcriptional regulator, TetR family [Actinopolyspora alba]|uniref:Transcriptional regulator, TetR family n=1 Tax=Actinopolyspora alba TaxID=673379 RepID=A0A1I1VUN0_9ACTN|nr:TetR/AcrR family transcriptional regulator [Actinopolyspora alba]SFD84803.1 transcriptional regulator, TetR family [Actinopolyspora alba]
MNPVSGSSSGRRERHKQRAKQRLYECALELFAKQGYDNTTVDEIAEAADVARGTFFNYFPRKEDLVSWWGQKRREGLREYMGMAESHDPDLSNFSEDVVAELEWCMEALGRMNEDEWKVTPSMLMAWVRAGSPISEEPYVSGVFAEIIRRGINRQQVKPTVDPQEIGNILRDVYLGALYRWSRSDEFTRPPKEELSRILGVVLEGILIRPNQ